MSRFCIVIADGHRARFFSLHPAEFPATQPGPNLKEHESLLAEDTNRDLNADRLRKSAGGPGRNDDSSVRDHQKEMERHFAMRIMDHAGELLQIWDSKVAILVADAHTLGLMRVHKLRLREVQIREKVGDVTHLNPLKLHAWLSDAGLIPARHAPITLSPRGY